MRQATVVTTEKKGCRANADRKDRLEYQDVLDETVPTVKSEHRVHKEIKDHADLLDVRAILASLTTIKLKF